MSGKRSGMFSVLGMAAAVGVAGLLGGCKSNRLQEERNQLYTQNTELQSELNKTRAALEAAENDRNTSAAELERLRNELAAAEARARAGGVQTGEGGAIVHRTNGNQPFNDLGPGVDVIQGKDRITVRLPGDVLFSPGRAELTASARTTLAKVAKTLNGAERGHAIRVEGYTDTDPIKRSKWKSNEQLSEARADAVAKYLEKEGVAARRVTTVGYGSTKPRDTKAKSRRVEIVVMTGR